MPTLDLHETKGGSFPDSAGASSSRLEELCAKKVTSAPWQSRVHQPAAMLSIHSYIYIYIDTYMHTYTSAYVCAHICVSLRVCGVCKAAQTQICMYMYVSIPLCMCIYMCMYVCMYVCIACMHVCVCAHTNRHVCRYIHTHGRFVY